MCGDLFLVVDVDCVGECKVIVFWCGLIVEEVWCDFDGDGIYVSVFYIGSVIRRYWLK